MKHSLFLTAIIMSISLFSITNAQSDFWQQTSLDSISVISVVINKAGVIYAADYSGTGVYRSLNNGGNWTLIDSGLTSRFMRFLAIDNEQNIYASPQNIYKSTNNGNSCTQPDTGLIFDDYEKIFINKLGYVFVTPYGKGIFRSTDSGITWDSVNNGLTNHVVWALAEDSSGEIFSCTDGGLFKSNNNGISWTHLNFFSFSDSFRIITVSPLDYIFAGTVSSGLYRSIDEGSSWQKVNTNTNDNFIRAMICTPQDNIIFL